MILIEKNQCFYRIDGSKVVADEVTVYDDGTIENRGSFTIDDEGTPSAKTILIEKVN